MKKTMLVLVILAGILVSIGIASAQTVKPLKHGSTSCTIIPETYNFPEEFGDNFLCRGTWMSDKTPYDPSNLNTSHIECSKYEMNCRISTTYVEIIRFNYQRL